MVSGDRQDELNAVEAEFSARAKACMLAAEKIMGAEVQALQNAGRVYFYTGKEWGPRWDASSYSTEAEKGLVRLYQRLVETLRHNGV